MIDLVQIDREWQAWRKICNRLKGLGIDINAQDMLAAELRCWGEELVALRLTCPEHIEKALHEARMGVENR